MGDVYREYGRTVATMFSAMRHLHTAHDFSVAAEALRECCFHWDSVVQAHERAMQEVPMSACGGGGGETDG